MKRSQINIDMPEEFKEVIDLAARAEDRTRNNWIYRTLKETLLKKGYRNDLKKRGIS